MKRGAYEKLDGDDRRVRPLAVGSEVAAQVTVETAPGGYAYVIGDPDRPMIGISTRNSGNATRWACWSSPSPATGRPRRPASKKVTASCP